MVILGCNHNRRVVIFEAHGGARMVVVDGCSFIVWSNNVGDDDSTGGTDSNGSSNATVFFRFTC